MALSIHTANRSADLSSGVTTTAHGGSNATSFYYTPQPRPHCSSHPTAALTSSPQPAPVSTFPVSYCVPATTLASPQPTSTPVLLHHSRRLSHETRRKGSGNHPPVRRTKLQRPLLSHSQHCFQTHLTTLALPPIPQPKQPIKLPRTTNHQHPHMHHRRRHRRRHRSGQTTRAVTTQDVVLADNARLPQPGGGIEQRTLSTYSTSRSRSRSRTPPSTHRQTEIATQ